MILLFKQEITFSVDAFTSSCKYYHFEMITELDNMFINSLSFHFRFVLCLIHE
jgi:hypothetical protein